MSHWNRNVVLTITFAGLLAAVSACGESLDDSAAGDAESTGEADGRDGWPETIQYGLLPTDDQDDLVALYTPFEEYMASCLDHPFELFSGTDYTAMVEAMRTGSVHVSRFGPFSYILAHERSGAEAFALPVADADEPTYQSLVITRKSLGFDDIADLEGKTFAFVDPTSSSGHLYPRAMIIDEIGISNDEVEGWFGDVVFAGNHEASLLSVLNGDTDAGALASSANAIVHENGEWKIRPDEEFGNHESADDFMVLAESDPIPGTVEAVQEDLPDSLKEAVMSCLEGVVDDPEMTEFLEAGGVEEGYIPAEDSDYDVVRDTADALGMGPEDLLDQ